MFRFILALAVLLIPTVAPAQIYQTVGQWQIIQNDEDAGCVAFAEYPNRAIVLVGLETGSGALGLDVGILSPKWTSIVAGQDYEVIITFDRKPPWYMTMEGVLSDDLYGLEMIVPGDTDSAGNFVDQFMGAVKMEWVYGGVSLGEFSLRGSRRAFNAVVECTETYVEADPFANAPPADPFAAAPPADPFAAPAPTDPFAEPSSDPFE